MALFPRFTGGLWKLCKAWTGRWIRFITGEPLVMYGIFWTTFLAAVVTVACAACQLAFTNAVLSRRGIGNMVKSEVVVRVPLDMPGDVIFLPVALFKPSVMDFVIPPMFAAVVVTASACFVYAVELWLFNHLRAPPYLRVDSSMGAPKESGCLEMLLMAAFRFQQVITKKLVKAS